jgi:hypothetical protein
MASSAVVTRTGAVVLPKKLLALLPGVMLLTVVGLAGKALEQSIARYKL